MGVKKIVTKMNEIFSISKKRNKHYKSINTLLDKLKEKEEKIKLKFDNETDKTKRTKQKRSLLVIQAHQKKAEKILNSWSG